MDANEFEKSLRKLKGVLQYQRAEEKRKQQAEEALKKKEEELVLKALKKRIAEEIEKWHDAVSTHLLILGKVYWDAEVTVIPNDKPSPGEVYEMAKELVEKGKIKFAWTVHRHTQCNPLCEVEEDFGVELNIGQETEEVFLIVIARDMLKHKTTDYDDLVKKLFEAFANGPLVDYHYDVL